MLQRFLSFLAVVAVVQHPQLVGSNQDRSIRLLNESGLKVEVHWINPTTQETVLMSTPVVYDGATFPLNSFVGHSFQVREVPSDKTGVCSSEDQTCHAATFTVSENDDQGM